MIVVGREKRTTGRQAYRLLAMPKISLISQKSYFVKVRVQDIAETSLERKEKRLL